MTDPAAIQSAAQRVRALKEVRRAEMALEMALEALVEHEGIAATRLRLVGIRHALKWY